MFVVLKEKKVYLLKIHTLSSFIKRWLLWNFCVFWSHFLKAGTTHLSRVQESVTVEFESDLCVMNSDCGKDSNEVFWWSFTFVKTVKIVQYSSSVSDSYSFAEETGGIFMYFIMRWSCMFYRKLKSNSWLTVFLDTTLFVLVAVLV